MGQMFVTISFAEIGTFNQLFGHHSLKPATFCAQLMKTLIIIKTPLNNIL